MYILLSSIWVLFYVLLPISNQNIKRNLLSFLHSIMCVIMCIYELPSYIFYLSSSYYTYDLIMQLLTTNKLLNASTISMSFHHIIGVYGLQYLNSNNEILINNFLYMYMLLEISNFPVYIMYHWKQIIDKKKTEIDNFYIRLISKILLIIEIITFTILRISYSSYLLITTYNIFPNDILIISALLYILSCFWLLNMLYQLKK